MSLRQNVRQNVRQTVRQNVNPSIHLGVCQHANPNANANAHQVVQDTLLFAASFDGRYYALHENWRMSIMYSTSLGLFWIANSAMELSLWTCCIKRVVSSNTIDRIRAVVYMTCMRIMLHTVYAHPPHLFASLCMGVSAWIAGINFGLWLPSSYWALQFSVVLYNTVCMWVLSSSFSVLVVTVLIACKTASFPTMYTLNPCVLCTSLPVYGMLCLSAGFALCDLFPPFVVSVILLPSSVLADPFTGEVADICKRVCFMGCVLYISTV